MILVRPDGELEGREDDDALGLIKTGGFPSPKGLDGRLMRPTRMQCSAHSHRRTFATVAMEAGVLEEIVGRLLNHTPLSIKGRRYLRPSLDSLRSAMLTVSAELDKRSLS
jgi:integrase